MTTIRLELTGVKELERRLERAEKVAIDALLQGLYAEAQAVMAESVPLAPADIGVLAGSQFVGLPERTPTGGEVVLGYGGAASAYARHQHEGVGPAVGNPPFMPPVSAFEGWAARVLGDPKLAFVVARSVGRKGLKPNPFLKGPLMRRAKGMGKRLADKVKAAIERGR
jgi:hypothetical protein